MDICLFEQLSFALVFHFLQSTSQDFETPKPKESPKLQSKLGGNGI